MNMSITEAKAKLTELVRRAEAGEEVVLTRNGRAVVRITGEGLARPKTREEKLAILRDIQAEAQKTMRPGPDAARSQDFLYDERGLPA